MRITTKAALAALALAGAAAAAAPAQAQQFGIGIGPNGGVSFSYDSGGYCDQWGCPDGFWGMPVYYGSVFFAGQWYDGPVYYRDWRGSREYWIHGAWRRDEWRGPHPGWWREGRYGPPLGMDYYRAHNFHGRWDHDRGYDRGPGRGGDFRPGDRGPNFAPGPNEGPRGDGRRDDRGGNDGARGWQGRGGPAQNAAPAPNNAAPAPNNAGGDPRQGRDRGWGRDRQQSAPAPAAPAPATPAPAAAPAQPPAGTPAAGEHRHHDDRPQQ